MTVTVFSLKPWTPEKISGMFIVSWPIRCEMKPQKTMDKLQQGSVTTWCKTTRWPFFLWEIFNFPFVSLWKSYFFATANTSHLIPSVQKSNYWTDLNGLQLWKFTTVQVHGMGKKIQKIRIEKQLAWRFWTACETKTEEHCLWLAHFFSLRDVLSSCVWSTDPGFLDLTSLLRKNKKCHSYLFFGDTKAEIRKEKFQYLKTVKLKISYRRKSQLVVSHQVVANQCCGLAVIFCHFISHQLVAKTKNIPEIFSGVHGFTGKTVKALFQMNFYCGGKLLLWLIGKRTSCHPIESVIILVINKSDPPLHNHPIC